MPLYFTHTNKVGKYEAVYNGRFAFARGVEHKEAEAFVKFSDKNTINYSALEEEFQHSRFFTSCKTGLALSGLMWITSA